MRPVSVIVSVILLFIAVARLASTCSKNEERRIVKQFNDGCRLIEKSRYDVFRYGPYDKDSIEWMRDHTRLFNKTVDSCIDYYRDIYKSDEKRYKGYLAILFQYKKMVYLYQGWVKFISDDKNPEKNKLYDAKLREFKTEERNIMFQKEHEAIEAIINQ